MPQTPYMMRHFRHDHGFTIPDPLLTKEFKIPNARERCHADKGTDWNLKYVDQWYGTNMNRPYRQHGEIIARARQGDEGALKPLVKMLLTDDQFYWRAVAANLLQRWCAEPTVTAPLIAALTDTNPLVRQCAASALGPLAQAGRSEIASALQPLLNDASRNVRITDAQQLRDTLDTNTLAGRDYLHFVNHNADQPLGQLQIGMLDFQHGDGTNALTHFQTAAAWDPYSPGVHDELASLLSQLGRTDEAVAQLRKVVELAPKDANNHFRLALALNDAGDAAGALTELEQAVKLDPHHARAAYNLGLARNAAGNTAGALHALQTAAAADPRDAQIPYARATILAQLGQINEARAAAQSALELNPRFAKASALLQTLTTKSANP
jgi:Flp pilus assembly protein TadD